MGHGQHRLFLHWLFSTGEAQGFRFSFWDSLNPQQNISEADGPAGLADGESDTGAVRRPRAQRERNQAALSTVILMGVSHQSKLYLDIHELFILGQTPRLQALFHCVPRFRVAGSGLQSPVLRTGRPDIPTSRVRLLPFL